MRRCCPISCETGLFTEEDCHAFDGKGTCTYPNDAQCTKTGMKSIVLTRLNICIIWDIIDCKSKSFLCNKKLPSGNFKVIFQCYRDNNKTNA